MFGKDWRKGDQGCAGQGPKTGAAPDAIVPGPIVSFPKCRSSSAGQSRLRP